MESSYRKISKRRRRTSAKPKGAIRILSTTTGQRASNSLDVMTTDAPAGWKRPVDIGASAESEVLPSFFSASRAF